MHLPNDIRLLAAILALFVSLIYLKLYRKRSQTVTQAKKARTGYLDEISDVPDAEFEIIAVHGLAAHAEWTWVQVYTTDVKGDAKDSIDEDKHLLRGLLKSKFPNARILSFVDDTTYLGKESVLKTTEEIGNCLLKEIQAKRRRPFLPLVFIGHSMGGIAIKEALCSVGSKAILEDTCGIIFLGTPHQGSSLSWLGSVVTFLTKPWGSDTTLVMSLTENNSELSNLGQRFEETLKTMARRPHIISFYETKATFLGWFNAGVIVGRNSAILHNTETEAIDTDHSGLNKCFGDNTALLDKLVRCINSARAPSSIQQVDRILREQYNGKKPYKTLSIVRLSGKALLMGSCYINLSIVEQCGTSAGSAHQNPATTSSFLVSSRNSVEDINKKLLVDLAAMFDKREGSNGKVTPRRILIRGHAGVGKTTLCKKMVHDFLDQDMWESIFDRVLWIPLRNLKGRQGTGYNLKGLFYDEFFSQVPNGERLAGHLWEVIDGRTLFILDGMDEVSQLLGGDEDMTPFLTNLLGQDSVIITSRPNVNLPSSITVDLELETIGFSQKQVEAYLRADPEYIPRADEIQSLLQRNWLLRSLVRIPIQLDALCFIWEEVDPDKAPETMSGIYSEIAQKLWIKDLARIGKWSLGDAQPSEGEIETEAENEIALLEYLAFNGLCNDTIDFSRNDVYSAFDQMRRENSTYKRISRVGNLLANLSFMRSSDPSQPYRQQTFHFIHLTYQEYFAARWFKRRWETNQPLFIQLSGDSGSQSAGDFVRQHKYTERFNIMWRFVSGLCDLDPRDGKTTKDLFDCFGKDSVDLLGATHHRLLMHCLAEVVKSVDLRATVEEQLSMWLEFECSIMGVPKFLHQTEFPAGALNLVFQRSSDERKHIILNTFTGVSKEEPHELFRQWLKCTLVSRQVRLSILATIDRCRETSSTDLMEAVVSCMDDKDESVGDEAAEVLGHRKVIPETIRDRLLPQLLSCDPRKRRRAVTALRGQLPIPHTILLWLDDSLEVIKLEGLEALRGRKDLPADVSQTVVNSVDGAYSDDVVEASLDILSKQQELPDDVLHIIAAQLQHRRHHIRRKTYAFLCRRTNLPNAILQTMIGVLAGPLNSDLYFKLQSDPGRLLLRNQKVEISKAAVARLGHGDATFRTEAVKVLERLAPFSFRQCRIMSQHLQSQGAQESDPYRGIFFYPLHGEMSSKIDKDIIRLSDSPYEVVLVHGEMSSRVDKDVKIMGRKIPWNILPLSPRQLDVAIQWLGSSISSERKIASQAIMIQAEDPISVFRTIASQLENQTRDTKIATMNKLGALADILPVPYSVMQEVAAQLVLDNQPINEIILRTLYAFSCGNNLPNSALTKVIEQLDAKGKALIVKALEVLHQQTKRIQGPILRKILSQIDDEDVYVKQLSLSILSSEYGDVFPCEVSPAMEQPISCSNDGLRDFALTVLPLKCKQPQSTLEAITTLFEHEQSCIRQHALLALHEEPELPEHILDKVKGKLRDTNEMVRKAAVNVLGSQKVLSPEILLALARSLVDEDGDTRYAVVEALCSQSKLDESILAVIINIAKHKQHVWFEAMAILEKNLPLDCKFRGDIVTFVDDEYWTTRVDVIDALGADISLPEDILLKVVSMIGDTYPYVRDAAYYALERQLVLPDTVLTSKRLYRLWLRASFEDDVCCYVEDGVTYLNMPSKPGRVQLKGNSDDLQRKIRRLQKELGVPSLIGDVGLAEDGVSQSNR